MKPLHPASRRALAFAGTMLVLALACAPREPVVAPQPSPPGSVPESRAPIAMDLQQVWVLKGILRQVGNHPHIEVVISGQSTLFGKGDYYVVGPLQKEIAALPPGRIAVKGTLLRKELELAGGSGRKRLRLEVAVAEYLH